MHTMHKERVIIAESVRASFARILHALRLLKRFAVAGKFALVKQIDAHHRCTRLQQFRHFGLQRTIGGVERGLTFTAQPNDGASFVLLGLADNRGQFLTVGFVAQQTGALSPGSAIHLILLHPLDLSGVSPQVKGFYNSNAGVACAQVAFKCIALPTEYPINDGGFRPLKVILPPGTVVIYRARIVSGELRVAPDEASEAAFFAKDKLPPLEELAWPSTVHGLEAWRAYEPPRP